MDSFLFRFLLNLFVVQCPICGSIVVWLSLSNPMKITVHHQCCLLVVESALWQIASRSKIFHFIYRLFVTLLHLGRPWFLKQSHLTCLYKEMSTCPNHLHMFDDNKNIYLIFRRKKKNTEKSTLNEHRYKKIGQNGTNEFIK